MRIRGKTGPRGETQCQIRSLRENIRVGMQTGVKRGQETTLGLPQEEGMRQGGNTD